MRRLLKPERQTPKSAAFFIRFYDFIFYDVFNVSLTILERRRPRLRNSWTKRETSVRARLERLNRFSIERACFDGYVPLLMGHPEDEPRCCCKLP
jgi:hypothetical protein